MRGHGQGPGVIQALHGVGMAAQPLRGKGGFFGGVGQQLFLANPALLVGLRGERAGRVVGELELAGIARQVYGFRRGDVLEHLVGRCGQDAHWASTDGDAWPGRMVSPARLRGACGGKVNRALGDNGFEPLDGRFIGCAADVACTEVVVVGEHAGDLAVVEHACCPVALETTPLVIGLRPFESRLFAAQSKVLRPDLGIAVGLRGRHLWFELRESLFYIGQRGIGRQRRKRRAEVRADAAVVAARVHAGEHARAIRADPYAHVEREALRNLFQRLGAAHIGRGAPAEFLGGKTLHPRVREDAGQRGREAEAVGQHVLFAALAEGLAEVLVAVEDLANDGFGTGGVDVAFLDGGACGKPPTLRNVGFHAREVGREVLLHEAVTVGAREVEGVVRVLIEEAEVVFHGVTQILVDHLGILPAPLGIEMGIPDGV